MSKVIWKGLKGPDDPIYKQGASLYAPVPKSWGDPLPGASTGDQPPPPKSKARKKMKKPSAD